VDDYSSLDRFFCGKRTLSGGVINESADSNVHTQVGKKKFIKDLFSMMQETVLGKVGMMPDEWDGIELRQYIADKFTEQISSSFSGKRKKDYINTVNVTNL